MLPAVDQLKAAIERGSPGVSITVEGASLRVQPHELVRVCQWLKSAPDFQMDYVSNLTAVDYPPDPAAGGAGRMDIVYHLYSMAQKHGPVALKVTLPRSNPAIASLTTVYRGAEFQEREVYDLFGVTFEGHPDLRRILMWDGFAGHPMRKDYVPEDQDAAG
jgi:NADH/F420H2 dehydrogenase subunit C